MSSETSSTGSSVSSELVGDSNKPLELLNAFLQESNVKPVERLQHEWGTVGEKTKKRYVDKSKDILVAVLKTVSPENAGYLWSALQSSRAVNDELGSEGVLLPSQRLYLQAIAETYKNASSWDTRRQILSIMKGVASLSAIREYIPGLSGYRFTVANMHCLQRGRGTPVLKQQAGRFRVDEAQLDHFLQFITSPHIIQDLPFGEKFLHLSNGNVIEVPNVIRNMVPQRIAAQYTQYCTETDFVPFSHSTMLRILSSCSATVRKSLQGLDYFSADGASAFDELRKLLDKISHLLGNNETLRRWKESLKDGKLYLKGDFKVSLPLTHRTGSKIV